MPQSSGRLGAAVAAVGLAGTVGLIHLVSDDSHLLSMFSPHSAEDLGEMVAHNAPADTGALGDSGLNAGLGVENTVSQAHDVGTASNIVSGPPKTEPVGDKSKVSSAIGNAQINIPVSHNLHVQNTSGAETQLAASVNNIVASDTPAITSNLALYRTSFSSPMAYEVIKGQYSASVVNLVTRDPEYEFDLISGKLTLNLKYRIGMVNFTAESVNVYALSAAGAALVTACAGLKMIDFGPCVARSLTESKLHIEKAITVDGG